MKVKTKKRLGYIFMCIGLLLIIAALVWIYMNRREEEAAQKSVDEILPQIEEAIENAANTAGEGTQGDADKADEAESEENKESEESQAESAGSKAQNTGGNTDGNTDGNTGGSTDGTENGKGTQNGSTDSGSSSSGSDTSLFSFADQKSGMSVFTLNGNGYIGYLSIPVLDLTLPVMSEWSYAKLRIAPCRYYGSVSTDDLVICGHNYSRHFGRLKNLKAGDLVSFTDMNGNSTLYEVAELEELKPLQTRQMLESGYPLTLYTCTYGGASRVTVRCKKI